MTLLERMKPEYVEKLESIKEEYPYKYNELLNVFSRGFWTEITLGEFDDVVRYMGVKDGEAWMMFRK